MTRPLVEELEKEHIGEFGEPLAEDLPEILHYMPANPRQPIMKQVVHALHKTMNRTLGLSLPLGDVRSLGFPGAHGLLGISPRFPQPSRQRWFWHLLEH